MVYVARFGIRVIDFDTPFLLAVASGSLAVRRGFEVRELLDPCREWSAAVGLSVCLGLAWIIRGRFGTAIVRFIDDRGVKTHHAAREGYQSLPSVLGRSCTACVQWMNRKRESYLGVNRVE